MGRRLATLVGLLALVSCADEPASVPDRPSPDRRADRKEHRLEASSRRERSDRTRELVASWTTSAEDDPDSEATLRLEREIRRLGADAVPALLSILADEQTSLWLDDLAAGLVLDVGTAALPAVCDRIDAGPDAATAHLYALLLRFDPAWTLSPAANRVWATVRRSLEDWPLASDPAVSWSASDGVRGAAKLVRTRDASTTDAVVTALLGLRARAADRGVEPPVDVLQLLRELGTRAAVAAGPLARELTTAPDAARTDLTLALADIGPAGPSALPELRSMLHADDPRRVRDALEVLERWGPSARDAAPEFRALLQHPNDAFAARAWLALARAAPDDVALREEAGRIVRLAPSLPSATWGRALERLEELGLTTADWERIARAPETLEALLLSTVLAELDAPALADGAIARTYAAHPDRRVRVQVALFCPEPVARALLDDPDLFVWHMAWSRIHTHDEELGPDATRRALIALESDNPRERQIAVHVLERDLATHRARIAALLGDPSPLVRDTAVCAIARGAVDDEDRARVVRSLADPDPSVRTSALQMLHRRFDTTPPIPAPPDVVRDVAERELTDWRERIATQAWFDTLVRLEGGPDAYADALRGRLVPTDLASDTSANWLTYLARRADSAPSAFAPLRHELGALRRLLATEAPGRDTRWIDLVLVRIDGTYDELARSDRVLAMDPKGVLRAFTRGGDAGAAALVLLAGRWEIGNVRWIHLRDGSATEPIERVLRDGAPEPLAKERTLGAARLASLLDPRTGIPLLVDAIPRLPPDARGAAIESLAVLARTAPDLVPLPFVGERLREPGDHARLILSLVDALVLRVRDVAGPLATLARDRDQFATERFLAAALHLRATGDPTLAREVLRSRLARGLDGSSEYVFLDEITLREHPFGPWDAITAILSAPPTDVDLLRTFVPAAPPEHLVAILPTLRELGPEAGFAAPSIGALLRDDDHLTEQSVTAVLNTLVALGSGARAALPDLRAWIDRTGDRYGQGAAAARTIRTAR